MPEQPRLEPDLLARFAAIVGERYALRDPGEQEPYLIEGRGLWHGTTPVVLRPGTVDEVAAILALAHATRTAIVPQGGNTGLVGGQTPHHGEVVLSLTRLARIREVDPVSNTMTCEAGVILQTAQEAAAKADRLFPLSLGAQGSCTIGGVLATNAGGTGALAYGVARDLAIGLEVVLADGRVMNILNKLKKDNTGYDLRHLFIGSEGTLGVITAAVLKLFARPRAIETAFVALPSPQAALDLLALVDERTGAATAFELMARIAVDFSVRHGGNRDPFSEPYDWYVLLELTSNEPQGLRERLEETLAAAFEQGLIVDAALANSLEQRAGFWRLREFISDAQKFEGGSIKHDVSVPVAQVPAFMAEASAAALALIPGCRPCPFGHLGDGNIHFNISQPVGADKEAFLARWHDMNKVVHALVARHGGSIAAEHGIGVLKRDELAQVKDPVALAVMKSLKATLDPENILNPGKVV